MRSPSIIVELGEHFRKPIIIDTAYPITDKERDHIRVLKSDLRELDPLDSSYEIISIFKIIETEEEVTIRESYELKVKRSY